MAITASGLLESDNITGCQLSKMKVGNGELSISVGERNPTAVGGRFRVGQLRDFRDQSADIPIRLLGARS